MEPSGSGANSGSGRLSGIARTNASARKPESAAVEQAVVWFQQRERPGLIRSWPKDGVYLAFRPIVWRWSCRTAAGSVERADDCWKLGFDSVGRLEQNGSDFWPSSC